MIRAVHMGLAALLIALPGAAQAWRAVNGHEVQALGGGVYEVVGRVGSGAQDYWCGIGDYATAVLGVPAAQRIYIWRPVGPSAVRPGRKAVHFALSPPPGADTTTGYSLTVRRAGDNLSTAMARQYCYGNRFDELPWRLWP
ncbi:hypothetical protein [Antarcticimicrobium luteum]|uniref:Uncharacterized protein n=1 Tax=Antarcticimicrobium luteum TaxID=2547397 RepID=A0A4R5VHM9_9RHOB|nr:hypothetical protein [Antarcticimicrobium luteum]TDK51599.1 hypothetical protein E1832_03080 [Antarcticimicrobium luteum]